MFTPPSPMSVPGPTREPPSPSFLSLAMQEPAAAEDPFPRIPGPPSMSPHPAKAGPSRIQFDVKKRSGRRILLFVALLPAALIFSVLLGHFVRVISPAVLDDPHTLPLHKRGSLVNLAPSVTPTLNLSGVSPTTSSTQSVSSSSSSALPTVPVAATVPTPFPQPFDASLTDNFTTQGCQAFFSNFTQELGFRQCRAFSFLLGTSNAFLQAQRNLTTLNNIIFGTCNTISTADSCAAVMANYLSELNSVCKSEITAQNPVVMQAQIGFQSYSVMRTAACLSDASTNTYCYVDAASATPPEDVFFYSLPLGTPLTNNTKPTCSPCLQTLLAVYAQYLNPSRSGSSGTVQISGTTGNSSASTVQPSKLPALSLTYPAAARVAVNQCGPTFASVSVANNSGARLQLRVAWGTVVVGLVLGGSLIL